MGRDWKRTAAPGGLALLVGASALTAYGTEQAETNFPPITVTAERMGPALGNSVAAALETEPLLHVRSQGGRGAQNDLSLRGSGFSGAGLALSGMALKNPQTEHFNAELPLSPGLLTHPELLTGLDQQRAVDGHPAGAVSLDFSPVEHHGQVAIGAGERSRNWQEGLYRTPLAAADAAGAFGLGLFGSREEDCALDYRDNDLKRLGAGAHLQWRGADRQADAALGWQRKQFGARGYYGVTPQWPADEEIEDTLAVLSSRWGDRQGSSTRISAMWRSLRDDYRLFWSQPGIYANHHRSTARSLFADGRRGLGGNRALVWRAGAEDEALRSNRLGHHARRRGALLLLPEWTIGKLRVCGGAREEVFSDDEPALLPQAGIEYAWRDGHAAYAAYTETVRQPSFTELNYESPGSLGNQGLRRQEVKTAEAGIRGRAPGRGVWRAATFLSVSEHTVDWVKQQASSPRWEATDLGRVETRGFELEAGYAGEAASIRLGYTTLAKEHDAQPYAGRYILDYPEHLLKATGAWKITPQVRLEACQGVQRQMDNAVRTGGRLGLPASLSAHLRPRSLTHLELAVSADNLWNDDFRIYPDLPTRDRRLSGALILRW